MRSIASTFPSYHMPPSIRILLRCSISSGANTHTHAHTHTHTHTHIHTHTHRVFCCCLPSLLRRLGTPSLDSWPDLCRLPFYEKDLPVWPAPPESPFNHPNLADSPFLVDLLQVLSPSPSPSPSPSLISPPFLSSTAPPGGCSPSSP